MPIKGSKLKFGPDYLIPKPFDSRLLSTIAPAVAKAAMDTGVATRPIADLAAYAATLHSTIDQLFSIMRQIYNQARANQSVLSIRKVKIPAILQNRAIGHCRRHSP